MLLYYQWFFHFYDKEVFHCIHIPQFAICSLAEGYLGVTNANKAVMNIHVRGFVWTCFLSPLLQKSKSLQHCKIVLTNVISNKRSVKHPDVRMLLYSMKINSNLHKVFDSNWLLYVIKCCPW